MRRRHKGPGRIKQRLASYLRAAGFAIEPEDLRDGRGAHRNGRCKEDCYRWEAYGATAAGMGVWLTSWDTMADCAKYGIDIAQDGASYDVSANTPA